MLNVFIFSQRPNRSEMIGLHLSLTPALCSIVSHSAFTSGPAFIQPLRITHNYHVSMTQNTRMSSSCLFIASWWAVENEYDAIRANGFERSVLPGTVPNRHCYPPCPDGTHCVAYKPNLWILSSVISPKCFSTLKKNEGHRHPAYSSPTFSEFSVLRTLMYSIRSHELLSVVLVCPKNVWEFWWIQAQVWIWFSGSPSSFCIPL